MNAGWRAQCAETPEEPRNSAWQFAGFGLGNVNGKVFMELLIVE
jgi:hypothetical protein